MAKARVRHDKRQTKRQRTAKPPSEAPFMTSCSRDRPRPSVALIRDALSKEAIAVLSEAYADDDRGVEAPVVLGVDNDDGDVGVEDDDDDHEGGDDDDDLVQPYDDPLDAPSDDEEAVMPIDASHPDREASAATSRHAIEERLAACAAYLYPSVRALCAFTNPVRDDRLCAIDSCSAPAAAICATCHATHSAAHLCGRHADVHDMQSLGHTIVRDTTKTTIKNYKCCDEDAASTYVVRLHTFDTDADKIFVKTCVNHHIGPLLIGIGFMPDKMDEPSHAFSVNIVATAAKMRACGAPYQTSFEGFYGIGAKSALYKPFVDATRHIIALQQHVHHQDPQTSSVTLSDQAPTQPSRKDAANQHAEPLSIISDV